MSRSDPRPPPGPSSSSSTRTSTGEAALQAEPWRPDQGAGQTEALGFYGKFPTLGDFVSRRLPSRFIQTWDQWLQQALTESRAQLGDGWLNSYLVSPLWRFVLSPGIAGQDGWVGLLMPSVDRVGRYFPLTLARSLAADVDGFRLLSTSDWFTQVEGLALSSLDDGFELRDFDARLSSIPAPPLTMRRSPRSHDGARHDAWQLPVACDADLRDACPTLLLRALDESFLGYSFWCTAGSERVAPSLLTCQGLPAADAFAAMLAGDWAASGWTQLGESG